MEYGGKKESEQNELFRWQKNGNKEDDENDMEEKEENGTSKKIISRDAVIISFIKFFFTNFGLIMDANIEKLIKEEKHFEALKSINIFIHMKYFLFRDMSLIYNKLKKRNFHITLDGFFIKQLYPHLYEPNSIFIRKHGNYVGTFNNINDKLNIPLIEKCIPINKNERMYRMVWGEKIHKDVIHYTEQCPSHKTI